MNNVKISKKNLTFGHNLYMKTVVNYITRSGKMQMKNFMHVIFTDLLRKEH